MAGQRPILWKSERFDRAQSGPQPILYQSAAKRASGLFHSNWLASMTNRFPSADVPGPSELPRSAGEGMLADRVRTAIARHPHLRPNRIQIETRQQRVILRGRVHSYFEKQMAQEALRAIPEIERIENELRVAWRAAESI
jgi:hypothetical protein